MAQINTPGKSSQILLDFQIFNTLFKCTYRHEKYFPGETKILQFLWNSPEPYWFEFVVYKAKTQTCTEKKSKCTYLDFG